MANVSSRARAAYNENTAVLYYEPSETQGAPVSTARIVPVGAANAARGGATLQLVGGVIESDERQEMTDGRLSDAQQPQVVEVEPPRAATRRRPVQKRSTRVIAYNVRIVTQGDEQVAYAAAPFEDEAGAARMEMPPQQSFVPPVQSHRHREMQFEVPPRQDDHRAAPFEMPRRSQPMPRPAQPQPDPRARFEVPQREMHGMPQANDMPRGMRMPRGPMAGSIPMSLFGALENMGGALHEQSRRVAARAHAAAAAGSYKQLLTQQLDAGHGGLLSNRNLCIAVGAYALILFLLAVFTG